MGTMPSRAGNAIDANIAAQVYADTLGNFPAAEVNAALRRFRLGELGDGKWAPTPAEVRLSIVEDRREERDRKHASEKVKRQEDEQFSTRISRFGTTDPDEINRKRPRRFISEHDPEYQRKDWVGTEEECAVRIAEKAAGRGWNEPLTVSQELVAQLRGDAPIGEGKLGAYPLAKRAAAE